MQLLMLRSVFPSKDRWTCRARGQGSPELVAPSGQSRWGRHQTGWVGRADPTQKIPTPPSPIPMQLPWLAFLVSPDSAQVRPAPALGQTDRLCRLLGSQAQDAEGNPEERVGRRGALSRAGVCSPGEKAERLPGEQARNLAAGSQAVHGPPLSCPSGLALRPKGPWFSRPCTPACDGTCSPSKRLTRLEQAKQNRHFFSHLTARGDAAPLSPPAQADRPLALMRSRQEPKILVSAERDEEELPVGPTPWPGSMCPLSL